MQIIIPMSGLGSRFTAAGYKDPKPLIKVDGKPIIEHVVNLFPGEKNIKFICNDMHLKDTQMRNILNSFCPTGEIYEVPVDNRQGPVHAVSLIFDQINDNDEVIVSYCDYGTWWDYEDFLRDNRSRKADGAIACYKGFHPHMLGSDNYAFLKEKEEGSRWMEAIQEKQPFTDNRMEEYASNGTYYFKSGAIMKKYFQKLMDLELKVKNEYYVSMVYNLLVEDNLKVNIFEIEHMLQWGTPKDLEEYNKWSNYFSNIIKEQPKFIDRLETTTILPLAGHGSRFSKKGYHDPKPLLNVNNLPMVVQAVKCLPQSKNNVFICLEEHLNKYPLEDELKKNYPESKIFGINQVTEGQACTTEIGVKNSKLDLEKPILITACDNGVYYDVEKYQALVDDDVNDIIVWSFKNEPTSINNPNMYAWMDTDENDNIKNVSCKKFIEGIHDIKKSHVIIGTMFFRKAKYFIDGLQKNYQENVRTNDEFYVDDVLNQNIKAGLKVKAFQVNNYICWGTPDDYETYNYWQEFFNKCSWHPYKIENDITFNDKIKELLLIGYGAIGDIFATNGMVHFLLNYYNKIYLYLNNPGANYLYKGYNRINIISDKGYIKIITEYPRFNNKYDIIDYRKPYYQAFCTHLKISNELKFPNGISRANTIWFYRNIGLTYEVMFTHFKFKRNIYEENNIYNKILYDNNISNNIYNIINSEKITHNNNIFPNININNLVKNQLNLIKLFENATELHMIDNSNLFLLIILIKSNKITLKKNTKLYYYPNLRYRGSLTAELKYFISSIDNANIIE